jgi:hypothetical protein
MMIAYRIVKPKKKTSGLSLNHASAAGPAPIPAICTMIDRFLEAGNCLSYSLSKSRGNRRDPRDKRSSRERHGDFLSQTRQKWDNQTHRDLAV